MFQVGVEEITINAYSSRMDLRMDSEYKMVLIHPIYGGNVLKYGTLAD